MTLPRGRWYLVAEAFLLWAVTAACTKPAKPAHGTEAEAKLMLEKVVARVKAVDRQQAFAEFTARKPPFFDRDLYVVCVDRRLVVVAHGGFPTYVGSDGFFKDRTGKLVAPAIWDAVTRGDGTVRYTLQDDETNGIVEPKVGFFQRIGDGACGVIAHAP